MLHQPAAGSIRLWCLVQTSWLAAAAAADSARCRCPSPPGGICPIPRSWPEGWSSPEGSSFVVAAAAAAAASRAPPSSACCKVQIYSITRSKQTSLRQHVHNVQAGIFR